MGRADHIRRHIDRGLEKSLEEGGFDEARKFAYDRSCRFREKIQTTPGKIDTSGMTVEEIEQVADVPTRWLSLYVRHADRRIIDLYRIEQKYQDLNLTPLKSFKLLLLKEKAERGSE